MKAVQVGAADYTARIRRAQHLASAYPSAAEVLAFYQRLAAFQQNLYARISRAPNPSGFELNLTIFLPDFPELLALLHTAAPAPVVQAARQLSAQTASEWEASLASFWSSRRHNGNNCEERSREPLTDFILRAFLQPYAEFLGTRVSAPQLTANSRVCPRCGSLPLLGALRPEADGGKRFLTCSFCLQEWEFRRIFCAACGEDDEKKLPVYVAEQLPHIRVEACETCKFYLRTIDLTKDGHAVPLVDDLAALPLSLWAHEHNYTRVHQNLLGT
jgi:FdhE protein